MIQSAYHTLAGDLAVIVHDGDMRVAELVLAYVRVLVWPLLVAALAVMFRSRVHHLFERMNKVDAFGASIEFAQSVGAAREALAAAHSPGEEGPAGALPTRLPDGLEREPSVAAAAQQALAGVPAWRWPPGRSAGVAMIEVADLRQARDALATAMDNVEEAFGPLTRGSASQLAIRTGDAPVGNGHPRPRWR